MSELAGPGAQAALLMPLGFPLGLNLDPSSGDTFGSVQTSFGVLTMDPDSYLVWSLAREPRSRTDLESELKLRGILDAQGCVADLQEEGLLVEMRPPPEPATTFYESMRLIPSGLAVGRRQSQDEHLEVRTLTAEICRLRPNSFTVWALSTRGISIAGCLRQCAVELDVQPDSVLAGFPEDLIQLVAKRGAFLDRA